MKFLCLFLISFSCFSMSNKDALSIININSVFSKKEIINNYDLCIFHNKALIKLEKEPLVCRTHKTIKNNSFYEKKVNFINNINKKMNVYEIMIKDDFSL